MSGGKKKKHQVIKFYSTHILQTKKQQLPRPLQKCHNHSPFTFFLLFFLGAGPSARPSPIWSSKQSKQAGKRRARAPPSRSSRVDMPHTSRESIQAKEQGKQAKKKVPLRHRFYNKCIYSLYIQNTSSCLCRTKTKPHPPSLPPKALRTSLQKPPREAAKAFALQAAALGCYLLARPTHTHTHARLSHQGQRALATRADSANLQMATHRLRVLCLTHTTHNRPGRKPFAMHHRKSQPRPFDACLCGLARLIMQWPSPSPTRISAHAVG